MKGFSRAVLVVSLLFPAAAPALTLEEGLKIVDEAGRDARIARSQEDAARSAWLPQSSGASSWRSS
ncbi:MAG: hypothetical protein M0042_05475 [Nitrospiraceae bacterium]|nr:hypothetical protein [Nitrospiraceae bacterium]